MSIFKRLLAIAGLTLPMWAWADTLVTGVGIADDPRGNSCGGPAPPPECELSFVPGETVTFSFSYRDSQFGTGVIVPGTNNQFVEFFAMTH